MTMFLPEGVKKINDEKKLHKTSQRMEENNVEEEVKEMPKLTEPPIIEMEASPLISNRVSDVEYEDDYSDENYGEAFYDIPSMALHKSSEKPNLEVRDFSIDMWNGLNGLKQWGYNENESNE